MSTKANHGNAFCAFIPEEGTKETMPVGEVVGLLHVALHVCRLLKDQNECRRELRRLVEKVEGHCVEIQNNISTLHESFLAPRKPPPFFEIFMKKIEYLLREFNEIQEDFESIPSTTGRHTVVAFFKAPRLTARLEDVSTKIEFYDLTVNLLGCYAELAALSTVRDMVCSSSFESNNFQVLKAIESLKSFMQKAEDGKNDTGAEEDEIGASEMGIPAELSNETTAEMLFLFGKARYEGKAVAGNFKKDFPLAVRYFRSALKKGEKRAAFYLGQLHYNGQGVLKNYDEAFKFYHMSLEMDTREPIFGESLFQIRWCLSCGHGTQQDRVEAKRNFKLAYEAGSAKGAEHYGFCNSHVSHT